MRALEPRETGFVVNSEDGARTHYEVFGPAGAERTILFFPTWSLVHSRIWKMQVPYFASRGFQVITFDGRGNGLSDRPETGYEPGRYIQDFLHVCEALDLTQVSLVAYSAGARPGIKLVAEHPDLVSDFVLIGPSAWLDRSTRKSSEVFLSEPPDREGWNKFNAVHWRENLPDFARWFAGEILPEPHSTKGVDDIVEWAMETTPDVLVATTLEGGVPEMANLCAAVQCPTLFINGDDDRITPLDNTRKLQDAIPNAELFVMEGSGHAPQIRDPVKVNLAIHEFLNRSREQRARTGPVYARD